MQAKTSDEPHQQSEEGQRVEQHVYMEQLHQPAHEHRENPLRYHSRHYYVARLTVLQSQTRLDWEHQD